MLAVYTVLVVVVAVEGQVDRLFGPDNLHFIHHEVPGATFHRGPHGHHPPRPVSAPPGPISGPFPRPKPVAGPAKPFSHPNPHPSNPPPPKPHQPNPHPPKPRPPNPHPSNPHPPPPSSVKRPTKAHHLEFNEGPGGCNTKEGFYFAGQSWFVKGCRRRTCVHFRGKFLIETDSCDSEIFNTTYKCIIHVDITADYPRCCPTFRCNPDNLGNSVRK